MREEGWDSGMEGPVTEKQYAAWKEHELYCQKVSSFGGALEGLFRLFLCFSKYKTFIGSICPWHCAWPEETKVRLVLCSYRRDSLFNGKMAL